MFVLTSRRSALNSLSVHFQPVKTIEMWYLETAPKYIFKFSDVIFIY